MPLTPKLIEILKLMNNGWELGLSDRARNGFEWWMQKGGLGRGGEAKQIHGRVDVYKLKREGLIDNDGKFHFPTTSYFLTDKGKQFLKEINV
jgi:hypothetical protein